MNQIQLKVMLNNETNQINLLVNALINAPTTLSRKICMYRF